MARSGDSGRWMYGMSGIRDALTHNELIFTYYTPRIRGKSHPTSRFNLQPLNTSGSTSQIAQADFRYKLLNFRFLDG